MTQSLQYIRIEMRCNLWILRHYRRGRFRAGFCLLLLWLFHGIAKGDEKTWRAQHRKRVNAKGLHSLAPSSQSSFPWYRISHARCFRMLPHQPTWEWACRRMSQRANNRADYIYERSRTVSCRLDAARRNACFDHIAWWRESANPILGALWLRSRYVSKHTQSNSIVSHLGKRS